MVSSLLFAVGVLLMAPPALVLGWGGLRRRSGHYSSDVGADRASLVLLVTLRSLVLLLVFALSVIVLVSTVGALVRGVELHGMVSVLFALDALLVALVLLTFGRRDRRRVRRRVTPAGR
ncbi:hypothetical protein ACI782_09920 [Geodermatophilus sp. SYSU D00703]